MARIFHDGFETGRPIKTSSGWAHSLWEISSAHYDENRRFIGVQSSSLFGSSYILRSERTGTITLSSGARIRKSLGQSFLEHYGRVKVYVSSCGTTGHDFIFFEDAGGSNVLNIRFSRSGSFVNVHLYRQSTLLATCSESFSTGTAVRLEWRILYDDTNGVFELKRNGDTILSYQGDTRGTGAVEGVGRVGLGMRQNTGTEGNHVIYFDDYAINDTTGSVNNSWVGPGSILLLKPKGAGNYTQWTPDSGNNFARVNEIPYSAAAYVESDTADQIDTYEMQTLADLGVDTSDPAFNIKAVQHLMIGRWDEAETELARVLRLGTTDNTGVAVEISNAYYRYWDEVFDVNPFDSQPWDNDDLNNLEAGIKHKEWGGI